MDYQIVGWLIKNRNGKDLEGSHRGLFLGNYASACRTQLGKPIETSINIIDVSAGIRTGHLWNINQRRYRVSKFLVNLSIIFGPKKKKITVE